MQTKSTSLLLLVFLWLFGWSAEARADISAEASLSHLSFPVDQGAMLTITVNGANRISNIELPAIAEVTLQSRGQSSRINIVNGSMTSSLSTNYLVQAEKPGVYTIPPIKVHVGGDTVATSPLSFEVTAASPSTGGGSGENAPEEVAFIRVSELSDHYPGEIVPVRIKTYFSHKYRADIDSLPTLSGDGVVMSPLKEKPSQTQERVNGVPYNVLTWTTTLSGIKAGKHPLTFSMEASLLVPQRRRPSSPFGGGLFDDSAFNDPFFDSFFGGHQRKPIHVKSPEIVFNVIPLPTPGQPQDFTGAIGDFTLKVRANRQELEVGEPLKLSMEISGSGNFDRVEAPSFPDNSDWKTYAPTGDFSSQGNSYTGVKVFDQAVVAKNAAIQEIPSLAFSYFDPKKKDYVTLTSAPIAITVKPGTGVASAPPQPQQAAAEPKPVAPEKPSRRFEQMAPQSLSIGTFHSEILPLFMRSWYLAAAIFCLLVLIALVVWQLWAANRARHPEKELRRRRNQLLAHDMSLIEKACGANDGKAFLALAKTAIQNQLGISWNMTATAISLADLRTRLEPDSPLMQLFAAADAAAYGGAGLSPEKMQDCLRMMKKELEALP